jgi:hypothetical protein
LVAAVLALFVSSSVYLIFSRWPSYRFTTFSDYAGVAVSILIGAVFIATLPISARQRVLSLLIYVPVLAVLLIFYTLMFVTVVFRDGL